MSAYINEITIMGNLGKDPELRYFANGTASLRISIATQEQWTDQDTGEVKEGTQWHTASLVGKQAEIVAKYMNKGDKIWVRGPLQTRIYEDDRIGMNRLSVFVKVHDMKMIHTKIRHEEKADEKSQQAAPLQENAELSQVQANPLEQFG
ncbi:single-stranded DNA-binding protein [Advenella kashmirensis W13003]|uniref:Single-stranded DNA-binding protein n=1 Tax=Advenella kashmirensis W13003 TaxID=1424334 RepID=V8QNL6_9BURK|nr:single-stranded DNA-binding protein [Advenella kashmirensis]ETF00569.1 single-stranded DNA-binding protein [Advenella kashmirensis W13003]